MATLAEKLKKLRMKHRMSMSQVSRLSELSADQRGRITQGYISRLESGKETNPSLQKLLTLCRIYNVEPNELFADSGRKQRSKNAFSTTTARTATQETEAGIRRVAEAMAKSPKYLTAIRNLLENSKGRRMLTLIGSGPEHLREKFLDRGLACWLKNKPEK